MPYLPKIKMGAFVIANSGETENAESIYFYTAQFIQYIEDFRFTLGYHYYDSLQGRKPTILYNTGSVKGVAKGNTLDANGTYAYDYHIAELALQVVGAFNDSDFMGGGTQWTRSSIYGWIPASQKYTASIYLYGYYRKSKS